MAILVILSCLGIFCMLMGLFKVNIKVIVGISVLALVACLASIPFSLEYISPLFVNNMVVFDSYAIAFSAVLISCTLLLIGLSEPFLKHLKGFAPEHFALIFFSLTGMICMVSFQHLSMLFIGIEIMSVALYVLAGSNKSQLASNEASLKYFLMGAFSTGFILMGITFIYGETSSFYLDAISQYTSNFASTQAVGTPTSPLLLLGVSMILVGLLFKVSAVPFHFWTPDVYEGSPDFITAFMSAIAKAASIGAFYRLFAAGFVSLREFQVNTHSEISHWSNILGVISAVTITVGSLGAVYQYNIKRMLAYSSIANAGFMLIAIMVSGTDNEQSVIFYAGAYAVAVISAFGVIMVVSNRAQNDSISSFNGLLKTNPIMAVVLTISMLSLAGIPLTAGFFGKFLVLFNAIDTGFIWLAVLGVINSMIGIYYYFKVIIAVNFYTPASEEKYEMGFVHKATMIVGSGITLLFGIFPNLINKLLE